MPFTTIQPIVAALPFHLDDAQQVNATFCRWHAHRRTTDKRLIDLWVYGYTYRYFLIKLAPSGRSTSAAFDQVVADAFSDVQAHLEDVRQPNRFTGWVGTICHHAFVNYLRTRRSTVTLEDGHPVLSTSTDAALSMPSHDAAIVYQSVATAIDALPPFLSEVTRLRLLEQRSYKAISRATGKPEANLRVYYQRALERLRQDPSLRTLLRELRD